MERSKIVVVVGIERECLRAGILTATEDNKPTDQLLARVIVGMSQKDAEGRKQLTFIAHLQDSIMITESFSWSDGRALFDTNTSHLRKLQHSGREVRHVNVVKWDHHSIHPIETRRL